MHVSIDTYVNAHARTHTHIHTYTKEKDTSFGDTREEHTGNTSLWALIITLGTLLYQLRK